MTDLTLWKEKSRNLREMQWGSKMSGIIKELIGRECTIDGDGIYGHSCTILDADDEWVKLIVHERKATAP